ncbi:MAG: hypothetical protein EHM42_16030 [Planctomycetaceae bacterium]|nr:MAG: hypothetical protein EHM42_16030 [Planctomycetaceae bacterium]
MRSSVVDLICRVAAVPSFSSFEDRLHPLLFEILAGCPGAAIERVPDHNLLVAIPGTRPGPPVALAAHLDKIDHYPEGTAELPVMVRDGKIVGAMDDSAGLGLVLAVACQAAYKRFPALILLLSEMEESFGFKRHRQRLRAGGAGIEPGQGAERLSRHLLASGRRPSAVVTFDTTPLFRGAAGRSLYCAPWELNGVPAGPELRQATALLRDQFLALDPELKIANNTNDYLTYGAQLNPAGAPPIPSVALEPSIYPYHCAGEEVFVEDILRLEQLMVRFLERETSVPEHL